ncbi:MAG: hypothetical protein CMF70_11160 [Magnetovibrio sp.]|nr:hypothetical protein [Magnetovibrio sp.]
MVVFQIPTNCSIVIKNLYLDFMNEKDFSLYYFFSDIGIIGGSCVYCNLENSRPTDGGRKKPA